MAFFSDCFLFGEGSRHSMASHGRAAACAAPRLGLRQAGACQAGIETLVRAMPRSTACPLGPWPHPPRLRPPPLPPAAPPPPPQSARSAAAPAGRCAPPRGTRPAGALAAAPGTPRCQSRPAPRPPRAAPCRDRGGRGAAASGDWWRVQCSSAAWGTRRERAAAACERLWCLGTLRVVSWSMALACSATAPNPRAGPPAPPSRQQHTFVQTQVEVEV